MADKKFFVSKEELDEAYIELQSMGLVAKRFGVSKKLVLNYMDKYEIPRFVRDTQSRIDEISIKAMDGWDSAKIASSMQISVVTVNKLAKANGISLTRYHKGFATTDSGYILVRKPDHPNADKKGYIRKHILIVSEKLGRPLTDNEVVHHIDENKSNNDLSNLQLMTKYEHKSFHSRKPRKRNI